VKNSQELRDLQVWFQTAITHPEGLRRGLAAAGGYSAGGLVKASGALSPIDHLLIYAGDYDARLMECLRNDYPALLKALGEDLFMRFAHDYLARYPSRHFSLERLGAKLPEFLEETRPDRELPPEGREGWIGFMIELATLERIFRDVFDGVGPEKAPPLDLVSMDADGLQTAPWVRLCRFGFPVHRYLTAARAGEDPAVPEPEESFVAVTRWDYTVRFHELTGQQYEVLSRGPLPRADAGTELRGWMETWAARGMLSAPVAGS
jgi:Putative DNA-binding domain